MERKFWKKDRKKVRNIKKITLDIHKKWGVERKFWQRDRKKGRNIKKITLDTHKKWGVERKCEILRIYNSCKFSRRAYNILGKVRIKGK